MKNILIVLFTLCMTACTVNVVPLTEAEVKKDQMHFRMLDVFKEFVEASNISPENKAALLNAIQTDRTMYTELAKAVIDYIEAIGKIDELKLTSEALQIYKAIKGAK